MGGKLFNTSRMSKDDFLQVSNYIVNKFSEMGVNLTVVPFYREKESFGDVDLLTTNEEVMKFHDEDKDWSEPFVDLISKDGHTFEVSNVSQNGIRSFLFDGKYQVDIIYPNESDFDRTLATLSWNDVGGMVGVLLNTIGFALSSNKGIGVKLKKHTKIGIPDHCPEILWFDVSFDIALKLVGLSTSKYADGFDTMKEIYDYIYESPLYYSGVLQLGDGNHHQRNRQKKRTTFLNFLEYVDTKPHVPRKYIDLTERLEYFGKLIGVDNIVSIVDGYARRESTKANVSAIIRDARIHCIQQTLSAVYPDMDTVGQRKMLQELYVSGKLNSSMGIEELVNKIYSLKYED